jgi:methylenetetrahydrofolate reductase (NADPH)
MAPTGCARSSPPAAGTGPEEAVTVASLDSGSKTAGAVPDRKQQILDFVAGFTIETTPGSAMKIPDYRELLRPGTTVSVTFLPGSDFADTVATAKRLKDEGFTPAPHFAARSIPSRAAFEDYLKRLQGEVGVEEAVALGGAVTHPVGEFDSSMQLLETGLFDKYGIKRIGLAGHPEGSPDISDRGLAEALTWKNAFAERSDAAFYLATQFCFEAAPIIAWDKAIRDAGNRLPIHIGIPGLATLKTLINHARACGIGPSMRVLTRQAKNITKLLNVKAPDRLVCELASYHAHEPDCGIRRVHVYPLGGLRRSAQWIYAVADGEFTLGKDGWSFTVDRDIE